MPSEEMSNSAVVVVAPHPLAVHALEQGGLLFALMIKAMVCYKWSYAHLSVIAGAREGRCESELGLSYICNRCNSLVSRRAVGLKCITMCVSTFGALKTQYDDQR